MHQIQLRWFGHVERRHVDHVVKRVDSCLFDRIEHNETEENLEKL